VCYDYLTADCIIVTNRNYNFLLILAFNYDLIGNYIDDVLIVKVTAVIYSNVAATRSKYSNRCY